MGCHLNSEQLSTHRTKLDIFSGFSASQSDAILAFHIHNLRGGGSAAINRYSVCCFRINPVGSRQQKR